MNKNESINVQTLAEMGHQGSPRFVPGAAELAPIPDPSECNCCGSAGSVFGLPAPELLPGTASEE